MRSMGMTKTEVDLEALEAAAGSMSRHTFIARATALGVSFTTLSGILVARAGAGTSEAAGSAALETAERSQATQIVSAVEDLATSLDPQRAYNRQAAVTSRNLFDTGFTWALVRGRQDRTTMVPNFAALRPNLYQSWKLSRNGRVLTVRLRRGIISPQGNELTADCVKLSYDRSASDAGVFGAFFLDFLGVKTARLGKPNGRASGVKVIDKYTVSIEVKRPHAHIVTVQTVPVAFPPYDAVEFKKRAKSGDRWAARWADTHGLGFSPWQVTSFQPGRRAVYTANRRYFRPAKIDTFVQQVVTQSSGRFTSLRSGAVQIGEHLSFRELSALENARDIDVHQAGGSLFVQPVLNTSMEPFTDRRVRQALNYAIPRKEITRTVFLGYGRDATAPVTDSYPDYLKLGPWPYDLAKARALLKEAGLEQGFRTKLTYQAEKPHQEQIAQIVLTEFEKIGVELQLNKLPGSTFSKAYGGKTEPIIFSEEQAIIADGVYMLFLYFRGGSVPNYSLYKNATVDRLIEEALFTTSAAVKKRNVQQAQRIIWSDCPWLWGWYEGWQLATRESVRGVTWGAQNDYDWGALSLRA